MVTCQFVLPLWLVQTQFMSIFMAVVGLTIAATPASALSFKTDNFTINYSVNTLNDNHTSLIELPLNLNQVPPDDFDTQRILAGTYTTDNQVSQLLQKAQSNIGEIIQASEVSNETIDGKTFYKYDVGDTNSKTKETLTYTNTWKAPASPPKRRIPEPSTILGLTAIASLFVTQRQKMKIP
ncbi:PEP-CTERM sorting domain-containing protein [Plectonema radiosum NIES-515]|uniref:PEP-CTERM sorting domain-containing protein n=1 Tax=Plectonema radiosum NIES-515 TaxID=2986073 RepID=A0ABT3B9B2_9CYAN|nr:PEP-CTERM sorting domain-containing protein [Plectonema radiosum]MCV3217560.1 PEP-CTERM sorting domain-containing protein [Plectonema radiosum NIES-515]